MQTVIKNGNIITETEIIVNGAVICRDGKIADIKRDCENLPKESLVYDACGNYVSPGFIDIHVHGGNGCDFLDGTEEEFCKAAEIHLYRGTTTIFPTLTTCCDQELKKSFEVYQQVKKSKQTLPKFGGLHLEGPYLASSQRGAQDLVNLRTPIKSHWQSLFEGNDSIARMTIAPELENAMELGDYLEQKGIIASIGHSAADYEIVLKAMAHGYTHVTHLYSGMSSLFRVNGYRHLGVVETAFLEDELSIEIIADGEHLPSELLRLIIKCKPIDKICLITDALRGVGMEEGSVIRLGNKNSGQEAIIENGVAVLPDHREFGGSVCTSNRCVRTMVHDVGVSLIDAVKMMSMNPAKVMGISDKVGSIEVNKAADLLVFDKNIDVSAVFLNGVKADFQWTQT